VNEIELMESLKTIVLNHYTLLKEAYEEVKLEVYAINQQLNIYNKFLSMVKQPKDFYKKNVTSFYVSSVLPILMDSIEELADLVDEKDYEKETERLEMFSRSKEAMLKEKINFVHKRIEQLNLKRESIGNINIYSQQVSRIKNILKSLNTNEYYENIIAFENIIEYISNSDIIDNTKNELLICIKEKRNKYLKKQEEIKKERELRKKTLEQQKLYVSQINDNKNINNVNKYKFNCENILRDTDLELIKLVNSYIYENLEILDNISQEMINLISESLKYEELELDLNSILPNFKIDNYKNIVILFESRKLLEKITKTLDFIRSNDIDNNDLSNYKEYISNCMEKIKTIFSEYICEKTEMINIDKTQNEKHIIYLTNSSNEILLKNDIKKEKENFIFFIKMLEDLKNGVITSNREKDVRFTNNGKLGDVCKKKEYHARLIYCPCDNCYIVFAGFIKKNNNNNYELNLVKNRYSYYKDKIDKIIDNLSDPIKKEQLIKENDMNHNELMNYLKNNSRVKKKELKNDLQ